MRKCHLYLLGFQKFALLVDHQPLVSILDRQTLDMVDNPKLQRLKEQLSPFVFTTVWRKGKDHSIPDALSRAPVGKPSEEDDAVNSDITAHAHHCVVRRIQSVSNEEGSETTGALQRQNLVSTSNATRDSLKAPFVPPGHRPNKKMRMTGALLVRNY